MKERLRLMESAVMNAGDVILITKADEGDPLDYELVFVNTAFEKATGYRFEDLAETSPRILYGPKTDVQELERIRRSILENRTCRCELVNYRKDGSEFWVELNVVPLLDAGGTCTHVLSIRRDITERKHAEEELRGSEQRLRYTLHAINDTIWEWDLQTNIVREGGEFQGVFGYPPSDHNIEWYKDRLHPEDRVRVLSGLEATVAGGKEFWTDEYRLRRADGTYAHVIDRGYVIRDDAGQPVTMVGAVLDITKRKEVEELLRLSEERFRIAAEHAGDLVVDWDMVADNVEYFGPFKNRLPLDAGELPRTSKERVRMIHPEDCNRVLAAFQRHLETRNLFWEEYRITGASGEIRHVAERGTALWSAEGRPYRFISGVTDITERKQAEIELARLAAIVQFSADVIISATLDGTIVTWNAAAEKLFGYSSDETLGHSAWMLVPSTRRRELQGILKQVQRGEAVSHRETMRLKKDGTQVLVDLTVSPLKDSSGNLAGVSVIYRDITERKRREDALRESQQQLRNLAVRIEAIREEERTRIAREVHDELGQALLILKLEISKLLKQRRGPRSDAQTGVTTTLIDKAVDSVHRICSELRPSLLDDIGLKAAIEWQVQDFEKRTGIACRMHLEDVSLGRDESTAVFRILQELLVNVARHSGATKVGVLLKQSSQQVLLEVSDNGCGLSKSHITDPTSLGIVGMQERTTLLGGTIAFKGIRDKGTTVSLRIPKGSVD